MILKIWNWVSELGVSEHHSDENELIRLYNRMCFISSIGILQILFLAWFMNYSGIYLLIVASIVSFYSSVIVLNFFGKIYLARYFISIGSPLWIGIAYLLIGGYFCQGLAIITTLATTYVAFQKDAKIRRSIIVFQLLAFFIPSIYVTNFGPIIGLIDFPYDEIVVFIGSLGWTTIVLSSFNEDRERLVQRLKTNNLELKNTTEELERFTYIASHDLKSPLRTIISFIGLIEHDIKREDYSEIKGNLDFVKTGAKQMNFLVQDILELSRLKNFDKADHTLLDLNLIFEKAKHNLKVDIEEKNAIVQCKKLPYFLGHELEILLLFQNFIQNGIKYNDSKRPTVSITSIEEKDVLNLSFKDNGIGIEEAYHEQIFQFFKRLHTSDKYQGTGLGLGLCKRIIDNYGGRVSIDSVLGQGSTFTILLPLGKP